MRERTHMSMWERKDNKLMIVLNCQGGRLLQEDEVVQPQAHLDTTQRKHKERGKDT